MPSALPGREQGRGSLETDLGFWVGAHQMVTARPNRADILIFPHDPNPALDDRGCRLWNQNIEDEPWEPAEALLITEVAAPLVARKRASAGAHLGVSEQMVTYWVERDGGQGAGARAWHLRKNDYCKLPRIRGKAQYLG